ncbi:MAG TPA: hypothetical protein VFE47_10670 [Tepidisphaeraceae bacterium]|jgi:hypothetical protein|nr:hypothetical protein [Tepidisphaeraceae bacterium]
MMGLRAYLQTQTGKAIGIVGTLLFVAVAAFMIYRFTRSQTPETAFYTTYICTETGKPFRHKNEIGETIPILSPFSGKNTGIPAEACYWTADGGTKTEPTWVLLNSAVGKSEPTFCPDCGRLVVGHNPRPGEGVSPPPTMQEYLQRHKQHGAPTAAADR